LAKKKTEPSMDTGASRLKPREVAEWRERFLKKQNNTCPLCARRILPHEAALDHDHTTGLIRRTLHRNCNSVEGRILHWARRSGCSPAVFLKNLLEYWDVDYTGNPLHPNHRSPTEAKAKGLRKRLRRAKRPATKARLLKLIQELQDEE